MIWLTLLSVALGADFDALLSDAGWESVGEGSTKATGSIPLFTKEIDGARCVRGAVTLEVPSDVLYEVVTDIPAAKEFTSETLLASRELGRDGDAIHYYQHLDVPGWTMAADRFWVLEGRPMDRDGARIFAWKRFDWRTRYPELAAELERDHPGALEPVPNFGAWRFETAAGGTTATYYLCSDAGGSLPGWLQKAAATKTFPNTMADVVVEARKRAGAR